jgi:hypothetical protein
MSHVSHFHQPAVGFSACCAPPADGSAAGCIVHQVPDALKSSLPVGEIAGVALLVFFGIKALMVSLVVGPCMAVVSRPLAAPQQTPHRHVGCWLGQREAHV